MIYKQGDLCTRLYLIKKGIVRGFFNDDGTEIITWISSDNEFFTSITGFFTQNPIKENIQCLESMNCDYIEYNDMQYCLRTYPEFRNLNRKLLEEYYVHSERRAYMIRIPNALEKWKFFLSTNNLEIVERIPKKYLAPLLGMRRETLSRTIKEHARLMKNEEETALSMGREPDFCD